MILHAEQIFDKVYLDREHPSDFIDYISSVVQKELVTEVIDKLKDHKVFLIKLHEPGIIEDPPGAWHNQCAYRQDLVCIEIVQCENCRRHFPWCHKFKSELGGSGFCPYGAKL